MLTQSVRLLARDGLVTRTVTASVPVRVDYQITPLGRSLVPVMAAIKAWADEHVHEIRARVVAFPASMPYPDQP